MYGKRIWLTESEFIEIRTTTTEGIVSLVMGDDANEISEDTIVYCDTETVVRALRELADLVANGRLITPEGE